MDAKEDLEKVDRLSPLPDDILVDILNRLDLKLVVATSLLSKRWRHLWNQITSIELDNYFFSSNTYMLDNVTELLSKLTSPSIRKFTVILNWYEGENDVWEADWHIMESWFKIARDRNVEEVMLTTCGISRTLNKEIAPDCIFHIQSLKVLRLHLCELLDMLPNEANLPNLKVLNISLYWYDPTELTRLVQCCPLLKILSIEFDQRRCWWIGEYYGDNDDDDDVLEIKGNKYLKNLVLEDNNNWTDPVPVRIIDAPECLKVSGGVNIYKGS